MANPVEPEISRRGILVGGTATAMIGIVPGAQAQPANLDVVRQGFDVSFEVNGKPCSLRLDPRTTLLDALRESAGIRAVMADLVAGRRAYSTLKWSLAKTFEVGLAWRLITST